MKIIYPVLAFCFGALACSAQGLTWYWGNGSTMPDWTSYQEGWSACVDPYSNCVYGTGWYVGDSVFFGNMMVPGTGDAIYGGIILTKYDSSGNLLWAKGSQNDNIVLATVLAPAGSGNMYMACAFMGNSMVYGTTTILNADSNNTCSVLMKLDSAGNIIWYRADTGVFEYDICSDYQGMVYMCGSYGGSTVSFGSIVLPAASNQGDAFIVKYDGQGNALWARTSRGYAYDFGGSVSAGPPSSPGVYLSGLFGSSRFVLDTFVATNSDTVDGAFFIARFDTAGNLLWAKGPQGENNLPVFNQFEVAADQGNHVLFAGSYSSPQIIFGTDTLQNLDPTGATRDVFIGRYDENGNLNWLLSGGTVYDDAAYVISPYLNNGALVTGGVANSSFSIANVTLAPLAFENDAMFILKVDSSGNIGCSTILASGGDDQCGISADSRGNSYICGDLQMPLVFGPDSVIPNLSENFFVARFRCDEAVCNPLPVTIAGDTIICANDTALICAPAGYLSYQWNTGQTTSCIKTNLANTYYVTVTDSLLCQAVSNHLNLSIYPVTPVTISVSGDTLQVYNGASCQWFLNNTLLPGDTTKRIIATSAGNYVVMITDSNGCKAYSAPVGHTGTETLYAVQLQLYPNPAGDAVIITGLPPRVPLIITNVLGQIVMKRETEKPSEIIDISGLPAGIYFVNNMKLVKE